MKLNRPRWLMLVTAISSMALSGMVYSLQAPFFPREAESKGVHPSQYGFVFGISELATFISSVPVGSATYRVGPKRMFIIGLLLTASAIMVFGTLTYINDTTVFLVLAFTTRIFEGIGQVAVNVAAISLVSALFSESAGTFVSWTESAFGLGLVIGPTIGGILFDFGGFVLPFEAVGSLLIVGSFVGFLFIQSDKKILASAQGGTNKIFTLLKIPKLWIGMSSIAIGSFIFGFLQATLEPHLRVFQLSGTILGLIFLVPGVMYCVFNPVWGRLCDKGVPPYWCMLISAIFLVLALSLIGPFPYIPVEPSIPKVVVGVVLAGLGIGGTCVPALIYMRQVCFQNGLPDNVDTNGKVGGLFTFSLSLGGFIGPSLAGILYEMLGFRPASLFFMASSFVIIFLSLGTAIYDRKHPPVSRSDTVPVDGEENEPQLSGLLSEVDIEENMKHMDTNRTTEDNKVQQNGTVI